MQDQVLLGPEQERFQFIFHELLFGDLDGVLPAGEHAYRVVPHNDHFPLVVVGDKIGSLQIVDQVDKYIDARNENDKMVLGNGIIGIVEPGDENQHNDDQGKDHGHDQPAQPDPVDVPLVIYFHSFCVGVPC